MTEHGITLYLPRGGGMCHSGPHKEADQRQRSDGKSKQSPYIDF